MVAALPLLPLPDQTPALSDEAITRSGNEAPVTQ